MRKSYKKIAVMGLSVSLGTIALSNAVSAEGLISAEDVISAYTAEDRANFHMDGEMSMKIGVVADDATLDVPIDIALSMDILGQATHGTINMNMSMMDQTEESSAEMYSVYENGYAITYLKDGNATEWNYSATDAAMYNAANSDTLAGLEWSSFEETDDSYILTTDFGQLKDSLGVDMDGLVGSVGDEVGAMMEEMYGAEVVYTFDKESLNLTILSGKAR